MLPHQSLKVELQNDLAINVFGWNKRMIIYHISKQPQDMPRINLLLIEKTGKFHYTWIEDLNRLLHDQSKCSNRKHFCERCLHGYTREDLLEAHKPECRGIGQTAVRVEMPEEVKTSWPFKTTTSSCQPLTSSTPTSRLSPPKSRDLSSTPQRGHNTRGHKRTQHHEACSYSFIVVRCDGQTEPPVEYRGPNAAEHFLESLQEEERKMKGVLANPQALRMTRGGLACHVCDKPLKGDAVREHCHITGKYRGAAHTACNLNLTTSSPWCSTTYGAMTPTCWCRPSRRWRAGSAVSPTTRRSISPSPSGNCASLTAPNSC